MTAFKTNYSTSIVAAVLLCFMFSCRISDNVVPKHYLTKRKYNKGWHVNNTSKKNKSTKQKYADIQNLTGDTLASSVSEDVEKDTHQELSASINSEYNVYRENEIHILQNPFSNEKNDTTKTVKRVKQKNSTIKNNPENKSKKTNTNTLTSFIIIVIWALLAIPIITIYNTYFLFLYLHVLGALFFPFLISTIIAAIQWKKCKDCYKNNGLLIPGIIVITLLALIVLAGFTLFIASILL